jgi:hypothetical protein
VVHPLVRRPHGVDDLPVQLVMAFLLLFHVVLALDDDFLPDRLITFKEPRQQPPEHR